MPAHITPDPRLPHRWKSLEGSHPRAATNGDHVRSCGGSRWLIPAAFGLLNLMLTANLGWSQSNDGVVAPELQRSAPQSDAPSAATDAPPADGSAAPAEEPDEFVPPETMVRNAFEPPPQGKALNRNRSLWIDTERKRVYADGYVAMNRGPLEMFACPMNTKEHESVVATLAQSSQVHAALLAIGAMPGTPVRYSPEFVPATGQRIRVWVSWLDKEGKYHVADARTWIQKTGTEEVMTADWVFAGSGFWKDPADGREYYKADSGDMICVSNFSTAMLDVPVASSAQAGELLFSPFTERVPARGTPVRLTLVPIPVPADSPEDVEKTDSDTPPSKEILTKKKGS